MRSRVDIALPIGRRTPVGGVLTDELRRSYRWVSEHLLTLRGLIVKIAVLGATGRTGALVASEARARGHSVVSVARRSTPDLVEPVRLADGRDRTATARAIAGVDAVAFTIGPRPGQTDPHVVRDTMATTVSAMLDSGIQRVVAVSADGPFADSGDPIVRWLAKPILWRVFADSWADLVDAERVLRAAPLDWAIVRPPQLTDGRSRRARRREERSIPFGIRVSRLALAVAVVDLLESADARGRTLTVAH
jgi:putative NADH-flavin reductase